MDNGYGVPRDLRYSSIGATADSPVVSDLPNIVIVGGLRRLERRYRAIEGARVEVMNEPGSPATRRLVHAHSLVLVVTHVSHAIAEHVRFLSREHGIPLTIATSASTSTVERAVKEAIQKAKGPALTLGPLKHVFERGTETYRVSRGR
ncbi:MAG: DUF2325 domain-containing protein [Polyangiaceae bacterium]